ncbi:DUF7546 family protein [Halohasta salina]|uniref:DUF7546 family protein n=1 Tax=Halohasta salina TaxID=2961621 RepID=UPI0020A49216|nr:hypothetical protein [Halohasta salina]
MSNPTSTAAVVRRAFADRSPTALAIWGAAIAVGSYAVATSAYLAAVAPRLTDLRVFVYPAVWLAASVAAAVWVDRTVRHRPRRWLGRTVGIGYVLGLAWLSGLVGPSAGSETLRLVSTLPGWGPIGLYDNGLVHVSVVPFKLVAYLALGHIVAVLVAATGGSARAAVLGMASCVSCAAPLLLAIGGLLGGTQATTAVASLGYDIATVVLVVTFGLLVRAASRTTPSTCRPQDAETAGGGP